MEKFCKKCGSKFSCETKQMRYCSAQCRRAAHNESSNVWRSSHTQHRYSTINCPICGKTIEPVFRGDGMSRPRIHEECIYESLIYTLQSGSEFSKLQKSRMGRMGITIKEIKQIIGTRNENQENDNGRA